MEPPPLSAITWNGVLATEEYTVEVDGMHAPPVFVGLVFDTGDRTDACIIHKDVQATEF